MRSWQIGLLSGVVLSFLWMTDWPLGVPGEWTWLKIPVDTDAIGVCLGAVQAAIVGSLMGLVAWLGQRRMATAARWETWGWLAALCGSAFAWLFAVQEAPPDGYRLSKAPWVLYYPAMTGYFYKARFEVDDTSRFLADYERVMDEGDVLHLGTHPPGLFLFYRGVVATVAAFPNSVTWIEATCPTSVNEALDHLVQHPLDPRHPITPDVRAALWLSALLSQACVVLAIVPLFATMRLWTTAEAAWKAVCFWPFVPTLAVFLPKDDVLFTGLVAVFLGSWLHAARQRCFGWGIAAGTLGWLGLFCSLVFLPIGGIALLTGILSVESSPEDLWNNRVRHVARVLSQPILGGLLAIVVLTIGVALCFDLNLLAVWRSNYRNHAGFYTQYARTHWLWVLVNPLELCLALGAPLAMLAFRGGVRSVCQVAVSRVPRALALSTAIVWGLLWLSGKNSGETARLWIPLMPFAVLLLPTCFTSHAAEDANSDTRDREWLLLLVLQAVVCLATVLRVSGFHFGQ